MNANPNTVELKENATLIVRAGADVCLRGWNQPRMEVFCDGERFFSEDADGKVARIVAKSDLYLSVPEFITVRIEHVGGDAFLYGMAGRLEIQKVGGDLVLDSCVQVDLAVTSGDLSARKISGPFNIQKVGGDLCGEELAGGLAVESVGGDARVQIRAGGVRLRAGGDLTLALPATGSEEVVLKAGGDLSIYVPDDIGARLDLSSGGYDIVVEVAGRASHLEEPLYVATLGDGSRPVRARAGGDIRVSADEWDEDDLSEIIDELIERWEEWKSDQGERQQEWSDWEGRIRSRAEAGAQRAEERVREAMVRVERQNRRREGFFSSLGFNWGPFGPKTPAPPEAPSRPISMPPAAPLDRERPSAPTATRPDPVSGSEVSNDERMLVLKMLQEHKITLEDAEQLLRSLEGDFE